MDVAKMANAWRTATRWVRHPTVNLIGNVQTLVWTGIALAGASGGALSELAHFSLVWLILTTVGVFGLVVSAGGTMIRARGGVVALRSPAIPQARVNNRRAIGRILTELERASNVIEEARLEETWWLTPLPSDDWQAAADALTGAGLTEAHRATRVAYSNIANLNDRAGEARGALVHELEMNGADFPPSVRASLNDVPFGGDIDRLREAASTISNAITALEAALERA